MSRRDKRIMWIGIVLFAIIAIGVLTRQEEKTRIYTEGAAYRTIVETVSASGKVQPEVEVKISADVSGELVEVLIEEGRKVRAGDLLVKINPDISIAARDRAEASLNTSRANLANARARLTQSEAQLVNSRASYDRNKTLHKQGAISEADYDAAKSAFEVAVAEVDAAKQSVMASDYTVRSAEASLKEANDQLARTTIFAPMDGTVSSLSKERGERVVGTIQMEGSEILRIADLQNMEVNVEVNESDIVRVKMGDTALVEVDAYLDRKFKGLVTEIANSANVSAHNTDQVTTFNVKVRILRSSYVDLLDTANIHLSPFRPGMSATVDIQTATVQHVLSIPIQSVTTREDSTGLDSLAVPDDSSEEAELLVVVFAYEGGKVVRKEVKTGIQDSKYIQVLEGVSEDEEVVAGPYSLVSKELEDGDDVEKVRKDELYNRPEFKR